MRLPTVHYLDILEVLYVYILDIKIFPSNYLTTGSVPDIALP